MMTSDANTAVRAIGAIDSVQTIVTSPPMGQYCFARSGLSACVVVCNTAGRRAGHRAVGRLTLHGGPVVLRPVRAAPSCVDVFS